MRKIKKLLVFILLIFPVFLISCDFLNQSSGEEYVVEIYLGNDLYNTLNLKKNYVISLPKNPEKTDLTFLGWDIDGDGVVDWDYTDKSQKLCTGSMTIRAIYTSDILYTIKFYNGDELLNEQSLFGGESVQAFTSQTKESSGIYDYTFSGWDCNNDGICETFPYFVESNLEFKAVFTQSLIKLDVRFFDGNNLLESTKVEYGSSAIFTELNYKYINHKFYVISGWDKNNDNIVDSLNNITTDCDFKAIYTDNQTVILHVNDKIYAYVVHAGDTFDKLSIEDEENDYVWYTDQGLTCEYDSDIMPNGNLELYGTIYSSYTIDTSLLDYTPKLSVTSKDEFFMLYNYLVFNRVDNYSVGLNFDYNSVQSLIDEAMSHLVIESVFQIGTSFNNLRKLLTMNFTYSDINNLSSTPVYRQLNCANVYQPNSTRSNDYDNFYINNVSKSYNVTDSEQLYYVLERGYRPIISSSNTKLLNLYNAMKNALRECCDDSMDNYIKALSIYDWIVMNVTYDKNMLDLVNSNSGNVNKYHAFYLEGVFNDHLAVCDGISKAYACLCNMEGIPCVRVTGVGRQNHAWNKIRIQSQWYIVDATSGGTIIDNNYEILTHKFFMIPTSYYEKYYTETGKFNSGITCDKKINYYEKYYYNETSNLVCRSQNDIVKALNYFKSLNLSSGTIEVYIDFNYGSSLNDEISFAISTSGLSNVSYTWDPNSGDNVLTFIKK